MARNAIVSDFRSGKLPGLWPLLRRLMTPTFPLRRRLPLSSGPVSHAGWLQPRWIGPVSYAGRVVTGFLLPSTVLRLPLLCGPFLCGDVSRSLPARSATPDGYSHAGSARSATQDELSPGFCCRVQWPCCPPAPVVWPVPSARWRSTQPVSLPLPRFAT